jgi:hypothetical protein
MDNPPLPCRSLLRYASGPSSCRRSVSETIPTSRSPSSTTSDYTRWFRDAVKDEAQAAEAEEIQRHHADDPVRSRTRLREAIERCYTSTPYRSSTPTLPAPSIPGQAQRRR